MVDHKNALTNCQLSKKKPHRPGPVSIRKLKTRLKWKLMLSLLNSEIMDNDIMVVFACALRIIS